MVRPSWITSTSISIGLDRRALLAKMVWIEATSLSSATWSEARIIWASSWPPYTTSRCDGSPMLPARNRFPSVRTSRNASST